LVVTAALVAIHANQETAMTIKPNLARRARLAAGSRPSLPGQDPLREEELRLELSEELQPRNRFEQMWIEDIAHRMAMIEVIRAQTAGLRMRLVSETIARLRKRRGNVLDRPTDDIADLECFYADDLGPDELAALQRWADIGLIPEPRSDYLADEQFAWLLGNLGPQEAQALRYFQILELEELRERDRIIRQLERRRRQEVVDAVRVTEARQRAKLLEQFEAVMRHALKAGGDRSLLEAALAVPGLLDEGSAADNPQ